jgi:hypothetical protein
MLRGQPAQRLSVHYQLSCDYGTSLITTYKEGEPVFLCASHATATGQPLDNCVAGVRLIEAESADGNNPAQDDQQNRPPESAVATESAAGRPEGSLTATKVGRETAPLHRRPVPDPTYGNSAKALVGEAIWNLPTGDYDVYRTAIQQGKPATEAAQSAGGQIAIVHRKISEYTLKIEAVLSESKATIDVRDVIDKPLEHAVLEIIRNVAMSEAEKDRVIAYLGEFQEQINRGLDREITPLQAHRIARAIGDRANWGTRACLSEELKPAFRAVYSSVRNAIRVVVPEANDLDQRLANLCAAKSELENESAANVPHQEQRLFEGSVVFSDFVTGNFTGKIKQQLAKNTFPNPNRGA